MTENIHHYYYTLVFQCHHNGSVGIPYQTQIEVVLSSQTDLKENELYSFAENFRFVLVQNMVTDNSCENKELNTRLICIKSMI